MMTEFRPDGGSTIVTGLAYRKKRGAGEVEVSLDSGETLLVDPELAVKYRLKEGMTLEGGLRGELERDNEALLARRRLVRYLSLRRKSALEAARYLGQAGFSQDAAAEAVAHARTLGLVDDAAYAEAYRRTRERSAKQGPRAIKYELVARGVDRETAGEAVAPSEPDEVQRANARRAGERKVAALRKEEPAKARQKMITHLLRKGYDGQIAREVARELLGTGPTEKDDE